LQAHPARPAQEEAKAMQMREVLFREQPPIEGYGAGGFRMRGQFQQGSILILPDRVERWEAAVLGDVTPGSLAPVLESAADLEILVLGIGADIAFVPEDIQTAVREAGLGLESMSTGAAARTYNVLITEDRRVAAALLAV
jgi:uncharacterized protein